MGQCGESSHGKHRHNGEHKHRHGGKHKHDHHSNGCGNNGMWTPILFTDFQYYNLGLPRNTAYPFMDPSDSTGGSDPIMVDSGSDFGLGIEDDNSGSGGAQTPNHNFALSQVDLGLGGVLNRFSENGRFKVPTLRNVELTAPYMHNGVLISLKEVVSFYNTRNTGAWGLPEVEENVEQSRVGNLGLSSADEDAIVAFMLTLTDGYVVENNGGEYGQCYGHKQDHHKHDDHKKYSKKCKHDDDDHKKHSKKCKYDDDDHKKHSKKCKHDDDDHKKHSKKHKDDDDD